MTLLSADALKLLSVLFHYPDDDLLGHLEEIAALAEQVPEEDVQASARDFLIYLGVHPPIRLQENYTAAFDLCPETTLNLTYHDYGDNEKRAAALARLQHVYNQAGWERTTGELPDYLPLILEFLSIQPGPQSVLPVWQCLRAAEALAAGLEKTAPAYAVLLRPLADAAASIAGAGGDSAPGPA